MARKKRNRPNYDIEPSIQAKIDALAAEYDIPKARIVNYLLAKGLLEIDNSDMYSRLKPSRSPVFKRVIDINDLLDQLDKDG